MSKRVIPIQKAKFSAFVSRSDATVHEAANRFGQTRRAVTGNESGNTHWLNLPLATAEPVAAQVWRFEVDNANYLGARVVEVDAIASPDADNDGVLNEADQCPDTAASTVVDASGCSTEQICLCDSEWKNYGRFVSCMPRTGEVFCDQGLISEALKDETTRGTTRSQCGK